MSRVQVQFTGLTELRMALRNLPEALKSEAGEVVIATSEQAQRDIQAAYPQGPTGNLRGGVTRETNYSKFGASARVRSRAKHAWIFENGTQQRRTANGSNRGAMPEADRSKRMIPIVIRHRRRMVEALKEIVRRAGFQVE